MTIMNNEAAVAILTSAAKQLHALRIHCRLSPMSLPQGMTVSLHVGESVEATLAAEVAATRGGEMAHCADTASHFSRGVAELLTEATIQKAAHIPASK